MFRRLNNQQNRNIRNNQEPNNIFNEEQVPGGIGNEALAQNIAGGLIDLISNESNNEALGKDIPKEIAGEGLGHYYDNAMVNDKFIPGGATKEPKKAPKNIRQDNLTDYYENDLNNLEWKKTKKTGRRRKRKNDLPLIPVDDDPLKIIEPIIENVSKPKKKRPGGMTEKELPDDPDDDLIHNELPLIDENELKIDIDSDKSFNKKSSRSAKNKKEKKSASKASAPRAPKAAAPKKEEDLTQIDQSLEPVQGWDYVTERVPAQKLPARKKQGKFSKFVSWLAYYSGKTIGKVGGIIATIGKSIFDLFKFGTPGTLRGTGRRIGGVGKLQQRGNRNLIPGWDGAEYEDEAEDANSDEVNADFRRVPEIWSWPTAEKAAEGDDKDRNAKPRDPVISVYIAQGSQKYTVTNNMSTGHSGIGIEYSRYNAMSGRWQRYNLRFGFYMGGGTSLMSKMAVTSYNNATIPGQILDEKGKSYHISRSYRAKPKQISEVLRAAESYADRGGYNTYTRNCTTFAKEMIVDVAKIKGAESVFAKDEVYLQSKADAKMFAAGAMAPIAKADMENSFAKIGQKDDLSYQNFGNKMLSKEDYERYHNSLNLWSSHVTMADSPNAVAENLRRAEGGKSGTIGAFEDVEAAGKSLSRPPFSLICQNIMPLFTDLNNTLSSITPMNKLMSGGMTPELEQIRKSLNGQDILTKLLTLLPDQDKINFLKKSKQTNLMEARTLLTDTIKNLNTLLFRYYRNDKRVQYKVLPIISQLNHGINAIDEAYLQTDNKDVTGSTDSDLGDFTNNFSRESFSFHMDDGNTVMITPSQYEAWLQVYKKPKTALAQFDKYQELDSKYENKTINEPEMKEYQKLARINALAMDFQRSHRYMLTKEKYNQQDIDYAFALGRKEQVGAPQSDMLEKRKDTDPTMANMSNPNASASNTYKMLIMKGVFGGMKDRFKSQFPDKNENADDMSVWLAGDTENCIKTHENEMTMILLGLKHFIKDASKKDLLDGFSVLLTKWMFQLFHAGLRRDTYSQIVEAVTDPGGIVMKETEKIATEVMKEN